MLTVKNIHYIFQEEMEIELSYVENNAQFGGKHSVVDYVEYINSVRDTYALAQITDGAPGTTATWVSGYRRAPWTRTCAPSPLLVSRSRRTRRRPSATTSTRKVEGYGLEFQGDFDYSFQSSYSGFDFWRTPLSICTWNTMPDPSRA